MAQKWNSEDFDQVFRQETAGFEDGFAHAERQGIPRFIEEYRISRVKDAIAPWIRGARVKMIEDWESKTTNEQNTEHRPKTTDYIPKVLDLGCGNGWYPIRLIEKWGFDGEITCIDVAAYNIELLNNEIASRGITQIKAMIGNIESLPFAENTFDVVYATETIEHVENPEKVFAEAFRILKPGGEFIITTPSGPMHKFWNGVFLLPKLIKRLFVKPKAGIHIYDSPMSYKELYRQFSKTGFELIHYHKAVFLPHESYIKFFPKFLQYLMLLKAKMIEFLGPMTRFLGLHHIIRLKKKTI